MNAVEKAAQRLKTEEGFRARSYRDSKGFLTIGYGFCIDFGITPRAAAALLQAQVQELHENLMEYSWYAALDVVRQSVCLDVAFNEGLHGLLGFPNMIAALARRDWPSAATECRVEDEKLDASRYAPLRQLLLTGTV